MGRRSGVVHSDGNPEAIAAAGDCLDVEAVIACVVKRVANLLDAEIHSLVEVDERPFGPEVPPNVVAGDRTAGLLCEENEDLERLRLQPDSLSVAAKLFRLEIQLEVAEGEYARDSRSVHVRPTQWDIRQPTTTRRCAPRGLTG